MSVPGPPRRTSGDGKKAANSAPNVVTRNGARKAKIQTRAMATGAQPSASVLAAKKKAQLKKKQVLDPLKDYYQSAMEARACVKGPTGLTTDPRMVEHRCLWDSNYPECPERLSSVIQRCEELNLIEQCKPIKSREATREELDSLHSPMIYEILSGTHQSEDIEMLEDVSSRYDAVYIHPSTHELSLLAAGSTIDIIESIVKRQIQNGAALIRPPGHHAMRAEPCGYCFYNNVALGAKHAIDNLGVKRVLIVDWDVHHGQATQQMFYDDPRVLYFSIHRYEHGSFWPNLKQSNFNYVGTGPGKGFNFNVPLNKTKMQDSDYLAIWHQLLLPVALEYQPELILISAGYDAALGCPEGEMEVSPACYAHLTSMLMAVCPSVCVVLEGGYCLPSLAEGAALTLRALLAHPAPRLQPLTEPTDSIKDTILNVMYAHKNKWKCFLYDHVPWEDRLAITQADMNSMTHKVEHRWLGDEFRPDRFGTRECYPVPSEILVRELKRRLDHLRVLTDLSIPQHQVCYVYNDAMLKHKNIVEPDYVECPERIMRIHERHRDYGLLDRVHHIEPRTATEEEVLLVHTQKHVNRLKDMANVKLRNLNTQREEFDSVYFHPDSYESASVAAGCVLQMVDTVVTGMGGSGVCVVRPPGHHAAPDVPCGFCLLNNAALAARYAVQTHGLERVLLLDWDVHHGNGTQEIFIDDPRVLYMSIHRYDKGNFFPPGKRGDHTVVGEGPGEGFNVNIPWNQRGMSDPDYLAAFTQIVLPIAYEYDPQLVIVSAGFDACVGDPLGGCYVTPECYGRMTLLLKGLANGKIILCLEGGYNLTSISYSMVMCTKALLGDPLPHHYNPDIKYKPEAHDTIDAVIRTQKKYWKNLKFQMKLPTKPLNEREPDLSRGLVITETAINSIDSEKFVENDLNYDLERINLEALDRVRQSLDKKEVNIITESCLDIDMSNLNLKETICVDGNCGTDDENDDVITKSDRGSSKGSIKCNTSQQSNKNNLGKTSKWNESFENNPSNGSIKNQLKESMLNKSVKKCDDGNCGSDDELTNCPKKLPKKAKGDDVKTNNDKVSNDILNKMDDMTAKSDDTLVKNSDSQTASKSKDDGAGVKIPLKTEELEARVGSSLKSGDIEAGVGSSSKPKNQEDKTKTLVDYLSEHMQEIVDEEMFAVIPLPWCPHLDSMFAIPESMTFEQGSKCYECDHTEENWVCLHCYVVACARSINGHMQAHYQQTEHALVLSLVDLSVWCNTCDVYVDNALLYDAKNLAHKAKFQEPMPWCYGDNTLEMH